MILEGSKLGLGTRLSGVSARMAAGQLTAIVGPNGAGKSTLLSILAGLVRPDAGTVLLDGELLAGLPARRRGRTIGYLPQTPQIAWDVTVETLVGLGRLPWDGAPLHRPHASADADALAVEGALAAMGLARLRKRPVSRLSGGERARVLAARVLAGEPGWILADEPLANLDLAHAASLIQLLKAQARQGRGVVMVLHDLPAAMNHADRVLVLDQGQLVADGPPAQALIADRIAQVWGVSCRWLGDPGARALAIA